MGDVVPFRQYKLPKNDSLRDQVVIVWCPELDQNLEFRNGRCILDGVEYGIAWNYATDTFMAVRK
jgi:hypothetical protein